MEQLLTMHEVIAATRLSRSTIYSEMRKGRFPVAVKIGKAVRWRTTQINEWLAVLPEAMGDLAR